MTATSTRPVELPQAFHSMTMAAGIRAAMQRAPGKVALTHGTRARSYRDLSARIDQLTNVAAGELGLKKGQNVAIVARNCLEYLEVV
jgi:acyl-CoA synthetase (AMP-forming)/AMP-acid ligase II